MANRAGLGCERDPDQLVQWVRVRRNAVAGVILLLHAQSDRIVRLFAVAAQAVGQLILFAAIQQAAGRQLEELEANQEKLYDGHVTFSWNPLRFGGEAIEHYRRVAVVFPGARGGGSPRLHWSRWPGSLSPRSRSDRVWPPDISF